MRIFSPMALKGSLLCLWVDHSHRSPPDGGYALIFTYIQAGSGLAVFFGPVTACAALTICIYFCFWMSYIHTHIKAQGSVKVKPIVKC